MTSKLLQEKWQKIFDLWDADGDGRVAATDLEQIVHNVAEIYGWSPGSPRFEEQVAGAISWWKSLFEPADRDGDGTVTRDEYIAYQADIKAGNTPLTAAVLKDLETNLFDLIDENRSGTISRREYGYFLEAHGLSAAAAEDSFPHLDRNGDGQISRDEFAQLMYEYFGSESSDASGNWLFGPR